MRVAQAIRRSTMGANSWARTSAIWVIREFVNKKLVRYAAIEAAL
jgi:hypothetical protein